MPSLRGARSSTVGLLAGESSGAGYGPVLDVWHGLGR